MKADRDATLRKLKTVRGQIEGLIKMVEDDRYCIDVSNQLMASMGILKNINREVLDAHLRHCVAEAIGPEDAEVKGEDKKEKISEIIAVIDKLMR